MDTTKALREQTQTGKLINQLKTNIKKDGAARKTKEYCDDRLTNLQLLFDKFSTVDACLVHTLDQNHPYIAQQFYKQVKQAFEETKTIILEARKNVAGDEESDLDKHVADASSYILSDDAQEPHGESKVVQVDDQQQQKRYKIQHAKVKIFRSNINAIHRLEQHSKSYYELKIKLLTELWISLTNNHEEIVGNANEEELGNEYFSQETYENLQQDYEFTLIYLQDHLANVDVKDSAKQVKKSTIKLPRIEIPHFNGDYKQWTSFRNLFNKTIHCNNELTSEEKMHYLLSIIKGDPAKLVNHLNISQENYATAWNILCSRYDDKRFLTNTYINTILELPNISSESSNGLRTLHDNVLECLHGINNQGVNTNSWDAILLNILTRKLDRETHRLYEMSLKEPKEIQTLKEFLTFLQLRFQSLGVLSRDKTYKKKEANLQTSSSMKIVNVAVAKKLDKCSLCWGEHNLPECKKFQNLPHIERSKAVYDKPVCRRCLLPQHKKPCNKSCELCKGAHHSLLHSNNNTRAATFEKTNSVQVTHTWNRKFVLLGTALVQVSTKNGNEMLRVLIDPGSQATFITEEACQRLKLTKTVAYAEVTGMAKTEAGVANSSVEFIMKPRFPSKYNLVVKALVFNNITRDMPEQPIDPWKWKHAKNLLWADPSFHTPGPIDILLGADYYGEILMSNIAKASSDEPIAQRTQLGWIFLGRASVDWHNTTAIQSMTIRTFDIDKQLRSFWEIEEVQRKRAFTKEELECEKIFATSHKRLKSGRYVVKIPFDIELYSANPLGCSKRIAMARLLHLERRLAKNQNLDSQYKQFMNEYIALGHMKVADANNVDEAGYYYLPHHAVLKDSSTTTKLRVVFDGSAKTTTGISLNDVMLTGPTLQQDLLSILLRWRKHKYVHTADIEKMFRQIIVDEDDQNYQRILWRQTPEQQIQEFKLTTVTYGTAAATYLAVKSLQQLAIDERENHPLASKVVLNDFYVDDLISGQNTLEEALIIQKQIIDLLNSGGFSLRKWATNNAVLLESIPAHLRNQERLEFKLDDTIKTLGLHWNPTTDAFGFIVTQSTPDIAKPTKRNLLSDSSKLFDPLGWLAPITVVAKLMMQETWLAGLSWDEQLPPHISTKWEEFKNSLPLLEEISIPRWIQFEKNNKTELHGFCDASEKAYAAVIYLKTTNSDGVSDVRLLTSKTKVAPIKNLLSLPRLELCGALLLTKLMHQVNEAMQISEITSNFWTDSMITLCWIRGRPHKYKTFVANRISEIQTYSSPAQWRHVGSADNPADCASRGTNPKELTNNKLWWTGPNWLRFSDEVWPPQAADPKETGLETKEVVTLTTSVIVNPFMQIIDKFSNLNKIIRIVGLCRRFINKCSKKLDTGSSNLVSALEFNESRNELIRIVQHAEFQNEIMQINKVGSVSTKSSLLSLNP